MRSQLREELESAIANLNLKGEADKLYDPIKYTLSLGGKRLRPVLVLMACELFEGNTQAALKPAMAIELFHNFTLIHDDIMDKAPIRRGKPTAHIKYTEDQAILSGDAMLIKAYQLFEELPADLFKRVMPIFNQTAIEVCEGQQLDMDFEDQDSVELDQYLRMIELKTAVLLAASLQIGALIGGASDENAYSLGEFGRHMGIAFQLQDDLLDTFGDPEVFGKSIGGDIQQNKKTYLLVKAQELADAGTSEELASWLGKDTVEEKVGAVTSIFERLGVKQMAETEQENSIERAFTFLDNIQVESNRKKDLKDFAQSLLKRSY